MGDFYSDARYGSRKVMHMNSLTTNTSVIASNTEIDRHTMMEAVTIKDWNLRMRYGDVLTGTADKASWRIALGKSAAGTGAVSYFGTAKLSALAQGGTYATGTVVDAACTETNLDAGDDLVMAFLAGTALPAGKLQVDADVAYVEHYT